MGKILTIEYNNQQYLAEFMGRQEGFNCIVCGKGDKCFTYNVFDSVEAYDNGEYETWGFGKDHLDHIKVITSR